MRTVVVSEEVEDELSLEVWSFISFAAFLLILHDWASYRSFRRAA